MDNCHALAPFLVQPTANTRAVSLRERSTEDLTQAIRSPGDEAYCLDRARAVLRLFYDPDMGELDRAEMLDEFGRALRDFPRWAVAQGFDRWVKEQRRRPAPGEIVDLAKQAMRRVSDEVAQRAKALREPEHETRQIVTAEQRARILEEAGFTTARLAAISVRPMSAAEA